MRLFVKPYRMTMAALAALAITACSNGVGPQIQSRMTSPGLAETALTNGLVHRVIMARSVESETDITIRSVIVNTGAASTTVEHRGCGLDYRGTLKLSGPPAALKCQAYSARRTLAAGDSIVGGDYMRVASGPGTYELHVRHVVTPEIWTRIAVVVR